MQDRHRLTVVTAIVLRIVLLAGNSDAAPILGTVIDDESGLPVGLVRVSVQRDSKESRETTTTQAGAFAINDLLPGEYELLLSQVGYERLSARIVVGADGSTTKPLVLRIARQGILSGRVTPPVGRVVVIERVSRGIVPRVLQQQVAKDGSFHLENIPHGRYVIGVTDIVLDRTPFYGMAFYPSSAQPREFVIGTVTRYSELEIFISGVSGHQVRGRVATSDARGEPFQVYLALAALGTEKVSSWARLIGRSEFVIENVLPGTYSVLATALKGTTPIGFGRVQMEVFQSINIGDLLLDDAGSVQVSVASVGPECQEPVVALIPSESGLGIRERSRPVGADYVATFEFVPPAVYEIRLIASGDGCLGPLLAVDTSEERHVRLEMAFQPPRAIRIMLAQKESEPRMLILKDVTPGRESLTRVAIIENIGEFVFKDLAPGFYHLAIGSQQSRWFGEIAGNIVDLTMAGDHVLRVR